MLPDARWTLLALGLSLWAAPAAAQPAAPATAPTEAEVLRGLRLFAATFQPAHAEPSLLAQARAQKLDWSGTLNLFASRVTDTSRAFVDWRGHGVTAAGPVFTTLRAGTYRAQSGARPLLLVNRQWCAQGRCDARSLFFRLDGAAMTPVRDAEVIPLIRDADFFPAAVPACLRGVTLGVQYLPARWESGLTALAAAPTDTQAACERAGVSVEAVTRPLRLTWDAAAGKFRRAW